MAIRRQYYPSRTTLTLFPPFTRETISPRIESLQLFGEPFCLRAKIDASPVGRGAYLIFMGGPFLGDMCFCSAGMQLGA